MIILLGWFVVEQAPVWSAPQPAWVRYPDLVALPGGCAAANALQRFGAQRGAPASESALTQVEATERIEALMAQQYPDVSHQVLLPAELVRGMFDTEMLAWWSMAQFDSESLLSSGASVFVSAQTGAPIVIITTMGAGVQGMDGICGNFTLQPRGLRARLRPYLPLMAVAGYVAVVGVAVVLRMKKQNP